MGILDKSGSPHSINGANAILRFLQFAFGAIVVGIYAKGQSQWRDDFYEYYHHYDKQFNTAIAAGSLSILTGLVLGILPFLVSYHYVAIAFVWDFILMLVWCSAFALNHKVFGGAIDFREWSGIDSLAAGQWFDLIALLLFLASGIMGAACLFIDWRRGRH